MGRRKAAEGEVEVRMLVEHQGHPCNSVQLVDPDTAAAWVGAGIADDSPEAIEYAKSLVEDRD